MKKDKVKTNKDLTRDELGKNVKKLSVKVTKLEDRLETFSALLDVTAILASTHELTEVLDLIMEESRNVIGAEASSLLLLNRDTNELEFYIAQGEKGEEVKKIRLKLGQGIAGWVAQTGESVLVKDAKKDPRFYGGADKQTKFQTKNLMAVALKGRSGIVGVVEVLNKMGRRTFDKADLKIFEAFAVQAGIAIENAKLYEMATTDGLTGLYTKRFFSYRLKEEMYSSRKNGNELSLLLIDIDHFKKVNDNYGHQAGDKVIIHVANVMKRVSGKTCLPCRYGGEELCIIAPGLNKQGILELSENIRKTIENDEIECEGQIIRITVSVGCVSYSDNISSVENFVEMSDLALYYGKENGRNAVTFYDPERMKKID